MSTKTTFKRVALVAVAALGFGTLSVVAPTAANAGAYYGKAETPFVVTIADTISTGAAEFNATTGVWDSGTAASSVSVTQVAGTNNYIELYAASNDTTTATNVTVTVTGTTLAVVTQPTTAGPVDTFTVNSAATVATSDNYRITGAKIRVMVPAAGTYTAVVAKNVVVAGVSTTTTQQTFTITGVAAATRGVINVANSTSLITDSATTVSTNTLADIKANTDIKTDSTVLKAKTTSAVAAIRVVLKDGQVTPAGVGSKELVASVAGSGLVSAIAASTGYRVATATTDSDGTAAFLVYGDGTAGVGTITITQGTTVIGTETVTFTGSVAAIAATVKKAVISTTNSASQSAAIEIKATDSAGNLVTGLTTGSFTATSSNTAVLSSTITVAEGTSAEKTALTNNGPGYYYVTVSSAAAGTIASGATATLTVKYTLADATSVSTAATAFTAGGATIYGVTLTADMATANAGDKVTLTMSATDKAGNPIADGTYVVLDTTTATVPNAGALTSTQSLTDKLFGTGAIKFASGKATSSFFAPQNKVTLSGLLGAAAPLDTTIQKTTVSIEVAVSNAGVDAATDAASEATDAANAATDAALAAADAADAATAAAEDASAAVAKLAKDVNTQLKALKKQITALTALVNRLLR
jgi:hypothetical protein